MDWIEQFWRLNRTETLLVLAVILLMVDIFFVTEVPTVIAFVLIASAVVLGLDLPPLVAVAVGLGIWFVLMGFHVLFWRGFLKRFANRVVAPDRYRSGAAALVGRTGVVCNIEGKWLVRVDGDLMPVREEAELGLRDGLRVRILAADDGQLSVERIGVAVEQVE